jgi:hypothetical protein
MCEFDVLEEVVIERRVGEFEDGLGDIVSGGFDWDIIVLLEVDTGLLLGWVVCYAEKLSLQTWVWWSSNVLPVTPLSVTSSASRYRSGTATGRWVAISISVESWVGSSSIPARTCWSTVATRGEVRSAGPVSTRTRSVTGKAVSAWGSTLACCQ